MNKITLLVLLGLLTVAVEGCSLITGFFNSDNQEETTSTPSNNTAANNSQSQSEQEEENAFAEEPSVDQQVAGLIPATNPEVRVRGSIRGRQDPFAPVVLKPQIEKQEQEQEQEVTESQAENSQPQPAIDNPNNITSTPIIETLDDEPKAVLAQDVIISGLVNVGGIIKLIVQAPEEAASRYVEVGQYLSNGKVLVKRVDLNNFPTPVVILEENGVEVTKAVGEKVQESTEEQAVNPVSNPPLSSTKTWVSNFLSGKLAN
jgi:hypothetical protein